MLHPLTIGTRLISIAGEQDDDEDGAVRRTGSNALGTVQSVDRYEAQGYTYGVVFENGTFVFLDQRTGLDRRELYQLLMSNYYVAGNLARQDEPPPFLLVKPSGSGQLPYVVEGERAGWTLFKSVEHHAHVYRLTEDLTVAIKVLEGGAAWLATAGAGHLAGPDEVRLSPEQIAAISHQLAERIE